MLTDNLVTMLMPILPLLFRCSKVLADGSLLPIITTTHQFISTQCSAVCVVESRVVQGAVNTHSALLFSAMYCCVHWSAKWSALCSVLVQFAWQSACAVYLAECSEMWTISRGGSNYWHTLSRSNRSAGKLRASTDTVEDDLQFTAIWNEMWAVSCNKVIWIGSKISGSVIWYRECCFADACDRGHHWYDPDIMMYHIWWWSDKAIIGHRWCDAGCRCWSRSVTSWGCDSRRWRTSNSRGCLSSLLMLLLWGGWGGGLQTPFIRVHHSHWTRPIGVSFCLYIWSFHRATLERTEGNARLVERQVKHTFKQHKYMCLYKRARHASMSVGKTPSDSIWLQLNHIKCSDKPIGSWPDRAEPATGRSTQVI